MHRLRDLEGRQVLVAAVMVVLVLVPFGASAARAHHRGWLPSGDDALIGLRTHDVLTSERPLVGQPSTSHLYGAKKDTSHPGPIEFYWLAGPLRVLGPSTGMLAGILVVNAAAVLVAAWVVLRRAGPSVAAWAMVGISFFLWSVGSAVLSDPISSNAGGISLLALAVLAWAVVDGDIRLLPLGAVFGSWVAQQHLAITLPASALVLYAVVGVAVGSVLGGRAARRREADEEPPLAEVWHTAQERPEGFESPEDREPPRLRPWVVGALAVSLVLWAPVIWQQLTGHPGNLTAIIDYARTSEGKALGWMPALRQAIRANGFPPLLLRHDLTGRAFFAQPLSAFEVLTGIGTYLLLVATAIGTWRRRRTLSLLAVTALVLAAGGTYNGTTIPDSVEAFRVNFYRWTFVVALLSWIALGWAAALVVRTALARRDRDVPSLLPRLAPVLAVALMLIPTIASATTVGSDDERRDETGFAAMQAMGDAAVAEADGAGAGTVTLVLRGRSAVIAAGPAVALQLEAAGHPVQVPGAESRFWGDERVLQPGGDPGDLILELVSSRGPTTDGPGATIATYDMNEDLRDLLAPLVEVARGADLVPSPDAEEILAKHFEPESIDYERGLLAQLATNPEVVLSDARLLDVVADGYFTAPVFDPKQVAALRAALPADTVNDEDVFELRTLTPAELAEAVPEWAEGS